MTEEDVRHAERLAEVSLLQRGRASLYIRRCCWKAFTAKRRNSHLLRFIEFNNIMRLRGREQVSHKTLSALIAELELYGYVGVERKGRGRGRGVDFYIYPTDSVERKALLDALKDLVV